MKGASEASPAIERDTAKGGEAAPQRRHVRSEDLFSGSREIRIEHYGDVYSLRRTSKGKLILTK